MHWEVVLVLILAIGIGISIKGAFSKRFANRNNSTFLTFKQHNIDQIDKDNTAGKHKEL